MYTTISKINTLIQKGHIKFIKSDSKNIIKIIQYILQNIYILNRCFCAFYSSNK